jgi:hypothetical protein
MLLAGRVAVGLLALVCTCACSSAYEPVRSPRIAVVMDGGTPTAVRDGTHYGNFAFGTGLVNAVQGNPRAEVQARIGRNLMIGGFVLDIVGLGSEFAGVIALQQDQDRDKPSALATGLVIGGLGAVVAGTVLLLAGPPHIYDAVNIYNDGVDAKPR